MTIEEDSVRNAEGARRRAMVAGDIDQLSAMIDDGALYVHTNGLRETKREYLDCVRSGTYRYSDVSQPEMQVRLIGQTALVTGRTILRAALPDGSEKIVDGLSVVVWRRAAARWEMLHYQGTSIAK